MLKEYGKQQKRAMARRFLKSNQAEALIGILTEIERALIASVEEQHEALGLDGFGNLPDTDDRAAELRQLALAKLDGSLPEYIVENYDDHLENADEAAQFAGIEADEWAEQKEQWAQDYREQGMDAPDEALVDAHLRARYGVDLETFENLVVNWSDKREAAELENILASGFRTAKDGIEQTTAVLEVADVDGEQVIEENDVVVSDP